VVIDIEQQVSPCLVVSHVSILQCLMAYFRNSPVEHCMSIEVPMHTVIKFTPVRGGGWVESQIPLCEAAGLAIRSVDSFGEMSTASDPGSSSPVWGDHVQAAAQRNSVRQVLGEPVHA
jgi:broad specificity phosphatase PhoE